MAVLKDLIVHGPSRFLNSAYFNSLKTNTIGAEQGIFNKLIATDASIGTLDVDDLTAQNATVVGLLDVKGQLHTNSWTNSNIATIDGSFYITPTIESKDYDSTNYPNNKLIISQSSSNWSINITSNALALSDSVYTQASGGTVMTGPWTTNSKVALTGEVLVDTTWMPLGTLLGTVVSITGTTNIEIGAISDGQDGSAVLQAIGASSTARPYRKLKISLYERSGANGSTTYYPIGIYMTATAGNKGKSFIDIYGGGNVKGGGTSATIVENAAALAIPNVRIGNLQGLKFNIGSTTIDATGWGIYTDNGYFNGTIYSTRGYIGGFGIDANSIKNGTLGVQNSVFISTGTSTQASIADSPTISGWAFTAGENFGVNTDGVLYAKGANIGGTINITNTYGSNIYTKEAVDIIQSDVEKVDSESAENSSNLSALQDIVNIIEWANRYGTFEITEDTTIVENKQYWLYDPVNQTYYMSNPQPEKEYIFTTDTILNPLKTYYIRTGTGQGEDAYKYEEVIDPQVSQINTYYEYIFTTPNPHLLGYYELQIDSQNQFANYIGNHLQIDGNSLKILTDGSQAKIELTMNGLALFDQNGNQVATYGTDTIIGDKDSFHIRIGEDYVLSKDTSIEYAKTTDVALDSSKTYYTRTGTEGDYTYTTVTTPVVSALDTYYEREKEYYTFLNGIYSKVTTTTTNTNPRDENLYEYQMQLVFYQNSQVRIAYMSGNLLYIPNSIILQSLKISENWEWRIQPNKNLTLTWTGGNV